MEDEFAQRLRHSVADTAQAEMPYGLLLQRLRGMVGELAADVAADLPKDTASDAALRAVAALLDGLSRGPRLSTSVLRRIRSEGAEAARAGRPLHAPIDEYLTSAWVLWNAAAHAGQPGEDGALAALGAALLRAGDDIAAALADGYTAAERSLAARAGATRRAVLEELLTLSVNDVAGLARVGGRASLIGLTPESAYQVVVVRTRGEIEDEGTVAQRVTATLARAPSRQPHLVGVRGRDLVVLLEHPWRAAATLTEALGSIAMPWWAVAGAGAALPALPAAYAAAVDALRIVERIDPGGHVVPVGAVALERALTADPDLARAGVDHWLRPLETASRGGSALVATLEAYFAAGESVAAAARALGVATRTVSYRLDRITELLGFEHLGADVRARLVTALLARRLLATGDVPSPPTPQRRLPRC